MPPTSFLAVVLCTLPQVRSKAQVEFFFEVSCPFCLAFEQNILIPLLAMPGVLENVMDYQGHPFGNAFFVTSECGGGAGYDMAVRKCYETKCGSNTQTPLADCYTGAVVCQHGEIECELNRAGACIKAITQDPRKYMPFVYCIGTNGMKVAGPQLEAVIEQCATTHGVPWIGAGQNCWNGIGVPAGAELIKHEAQMTPLHDYVPHIRVNGQEVDKDNFINVLCTSYQGPPIPPFQAQCQAAGVNVPAGPPPGAPPPGAPPPAALLL